MCIRDSLFTAGMAETGDAEMARVEREAIAKLRAAGIRTIGPNCLGLYVPASGMTFSGEFPMEPGNVFLVSQSGANASEIVRNLTPRGVRFSKAVSFGNGADLKAHDFFDYAANDPETEVVISYLEGVSSGRDLFDALKRCAAVKPTIILKGHDFFDYAANDPETEVVISYLEGVSSGRDLFDALKRCAAVKPTIILK